MKMQLWQEREIRHWSRESVAQKIGVTAETIRLIETGRRKPSYSVLVKLEDLFQRNHRQLFAVVDDKANHTNL